MYIYLGNFDNNSSNQIFIKIEDNIFFYFQLKFLVF